jgi:NTE family protein
MTRALVLGGGGPVGIAWETGLVVGLAREGVDLTANDFVVGTSAGSAVGAQIALGHDLAVRGEKDYGARSVEATADPTDAEPIDVDTTDADPPGASTPADPGTSPMLALMAAMEESAAHPGTPEEARAILGRFALAQQTAPESAFLGFFADLADEDFPDGFACTAIHAHTGEFVVWNRESGVPLQAAVASSCSVPGIFPPITIDDAPYIDGGMRSGLNADVAAGHDLVVVVSCMASSIPGVEMPRFERMRAQRAAEEAAIVDAGGAVHNIDPGPGFLEVSGMGMYLMDASRSPAAYAAGLEQARTEAPRLREVWS